MPNYGTSAPPVNRFKKVTNSQDDSEGLGMTRWSIRDVGVARWPPAAAGLAAKADLTTDNQKVNMKIIIALVSTFALAVGAAWGQVPEGVVKAKVTMAPGVVRADSIVKATVVAEVLSGYHINDHHPSLDYLIPTEVKLEPSPQVAKNDITYPKGELKRFAFSDTPLSVYEGTVRFDVALQVEHKVLPGDYAVKGQLAYQACNDHACLPPAQVPLLFSFRVAHRGDR
jgi:DsbC/DsbD-like thiol-disulfide interchange protein